MTAWELIRGRRLARSVVWSLLGQLLPALVALLATPGIVRGFGDTRFGLLALAWVVVGYFSLFDFGLGRAVTHQVSEALASGDDARVRDTVWTSAYLLAFLGLAGGVALAMVANPLVSVLKVPAELRGEARLVFLLLAATVPFVVLSTGFRGALEAAQAFGWTNAIRIPLGVLGFLVPLVTLRFSAGLVLPIAAFLILRLAVLIGFVTLCRRMLPATRRVAAYSKAAAARMLRFGAWLTVSNVVSPLMVSVDRFVIGALLSVSVVTYYATPFEAVSRLLIVPTAIAAVIFPALTASRGLDPMRTRLIRRTAVRVIGLALVPVCAAIILLAPELLKLWLGGAFPVRSAVVLRWLTIGVAANAAAFVPFNLIQAAGRSDLTGKAHLIELPIYAVALLLGIRWAGIEGAAIVWAGRVTLDCVILSVMSQRAAHVRLAEWAVDVAPIVLGVTAAGVGAVLLPGAGERGMAAGVIAAVVVAHAWRSWASDVVPAVMRARGAAEAT